MTSLPPKRPDSEERLKAKAHLEVCFRGYLLEYLNEPRDEIIEDLMKAAEKYSDAVNKADRDAHEEELANILRSWS